MMFSPGFYFYFFFWGGSLLTHILWGPENLPELAGGAQFAGQAEVYDLNVSER